MKVSPNQLQPVYFQPAKPPVGEAPAANPDQVSIQQQPQDPALKKWTVLIYSASDNNLYPYMQADLNEAEKVGSTDQLNVVAQTDHAPRKGQTVRLELKTNSWPGVTSPVKERMGDVDMGDPKQLADFIQWGMKNYPAENYALIISDHGAGWKGACHDESKDGWMNLPELEEGLKLAREATGRKLDVLGFDACLMAGTEVAHQLKDEAQFLVASQEVEGGAGWQYNRVLSEKTLNGIDQALRMRLNLSPREFAENVVRMAEGNQGDLATMTALDLSKTQAITDAAKNFADAIVNSNLEGVQLAEAASGTQGFYEYKDLYDFADKLGTLAAERDSRLAEASTGIKQAIEGAIVAEQHSTNYPGAHGLSIELSRDAGKSLPANPSMVDRSVDFGNYRDTKFAQDSNWEAAIAKIHG